MARQYVIDAEAAGSASPSQRSRNTTDASSKNNLKIAHSLGGDITSTTSSENLPPQLPPLHLALGSDTYNTNTHQSVGRDNDDTSSEFYPIPSKPRHNIGNAQQEETERFSDIPVATADTKEEIEGSFGERGYDVEELEDDVNEAKHFVPARIRYPPPKYEMHVDSSIPLGVILFLLGFLLPPLWWAGVLFPRRQDSEVARTWRKYNSLMTLLSLPLLGLFFALGGWHAAHS
ncbi:hypothetical protein GGI12_005570 [Dipsacomyces acuminosporus]|nr:hypothetical protein GGI12_005570 [Dipsacomyces acuminosporus]